MADSNGMNCIDCTHFTVSAADVRKVGYGNCKMSPSWRYVSPSFERECGLFEAETEPESIAKRQAWMGGLHGSS